MPRPPYAPARRSVILQRVRHTIRRPVRPDGTVDACQARLPGGLGTARLPADRVRVLTESSSESSSSSSESSSEEEADSRKRRRVLVNLSELCSVCLCALGEAAAAPGANEIVRLDCGHVFHAACNAEWERACLAGQEFKCAYCRAEGV